MKTRGSTQRHLSRLYGIELHSEKPRPHDALYLNNDCYARNDREPQHEGPRQKETP